MRVQVESGKRVAWQIPNLNRNICVSQMALPKAGFRFLSAETAEYSERTRWRADLRPKKIKPIEIAFSKDNFGGIKESDSQISVILGRNGQGKSRLLSAIALSLQLIQTYSRTRPMRRFPLKKLSYIANGRIHVIESVSGREPQLHIDGKLADLSEAVLPSKVIALSMTPFDKFPIGARPKQLDLFEEERHDIYSYFGMRDRTGRASVSSLLFRVVEGLFNRHDRGDRVRIAKVFDLIGYEPTLDVVFRVDSLIRLRAIIQERKIESDDDESYTRSRINHYIKSTDGGVDRLLQAVDAISDSSDDRFVFLTLDARGPSTAAEQNFSHLQLLRQLGFARLYAVEAKTNRGDTIDFKQASSGELSIAISFLALASNLQDDSLVLIDEPETNLHPEWQAKYVELLVSTFSGFKNCQYILATHSPLIVSDAPPSASIASVSDDVPANGSEVAGQPVDYLLAKAFQTVGGTNYYLQEEVVKALRLAADGLVSTEEFSVTIAELTRLKPLVRDNPGIVEVIANLEKIHRRGGKAK